MKPKVSLPCVAVLLLCVSLAGCGGSVYQVGGTSRAVGTDATITADEIEGGNTGIALDVQHLPPPDRLSDGLTTYLVWFTPRNGEARKAGILGYDADERRGRLEATSPDRRFEVRVTGESNRNVTSPSEFVVVRQEVSIDD